MTSPNLRYEDIFVPGGFPKHTYNPRGELGLEQRLRESKNNLCKLVTITGQTKSGKTVLARKIFLLRKLSGLTAARFPKRRTFGKTL